MTHTPDICHRFDKFIMPGDIPDSDAEAGSERSAGGLRPPVSRGGGASGAQDYGVPTQDWLSRGLRSRAGRGWETEVSRSEADDDPDYGLSYDYGQDPRGGRHGSASAAAKTPYDHYPSSAALLQAQRAGRMDASRRRAAAPPWPGGWQPGDPPREIVLDAEPCTEPAAALKFGPAQQVRFLDALAGHGNVRAAAARVGVSRETVYRARRREPGFANLWEAALVHAREHGEAELAVRAFDGVAVPVFVRGEHVATWRRHDARYLLAHLARLDRRIAAGGPVEREARARAERFDDMVAALAGQPAPADFAHAAQVGARLAAEDYAAGGREAGDPAPLPHCADLPPTRLGVFGLACERALAAQEEAVASGRKDYRDDAARSRADDRAVEVATAKAVARWEQWRADGRALLDRVLAAEGLEADEGVGEGERERAGAASQDDVSGAAIGGEGNAPAERTSSEISAMEAKAGDASRAPASVSQVSTARSERRVKPRVGKRNAQRARTRQAKLGKSGCG
jgi:hypothetical protein